MTQLPAPINMDGLEVITLPPDEQDIPSPLNPNKEKPYKPDDDELASDLAETWQDKWKHFHTQWHLYETGCWEVRQEQEVKQAIRLFLREYRSRGIAVTERRINALARMVEWDERIFVPDRVLINLADERKRYINLQNGLFNLDTFTLEPHNPDLYFTTQLSFPFDPNAKCPNFWRFLQTSLVKDDGKPDGEMISLVQEALAYSMTARTDLKTSFWLVGKPDSGKSTLISFIRSLMGSLHKTIDLNQLATNRFLLSGIVGKRVVTFPEADPKTPLPDWVYKAMVGGQDELWADVKNKEGITFVPESKTWWAMNEAPRISDRSGATFNRLQVILFNRTIPHNERIPHLTQILEQERAGVFKWAMRGYRRLVERGAFTKCEQSERWLEKYRLENDTERTFLNECCLQERDGLVSAARLHNRYRDFCRENGFRDKNLNQAAKEWERLGLIKVKRNDANYWKGIQLRDSQGN